MASAPSFPIWLGSLPRLKTRRELVSVLTRVGRYHCSPFKRNGLKVSIVSAFVAVCDQTRSR